MSILYCTSCGWWIPAGTTRVYRRCYECGHAWRTSVALGYAAWRTRVRYGGWRAVVQLQPPWQVHACPCCAHTL